MIPDFIPIISTKVDWEKFLAGCSQALNRSVSASLDAKGLGVVGQAAFIPAVKEFKKPNSDAIKSFRESSDVLRHTYLGFLLVCDVSTYKDLPLDHINISLTNEMDYYVIIATSSMYGWFYFVLSSLAEHTTKNTRLLAMKLLLYFEMNDLGEVWGNYSKESLNDGTYILRSK